MTTETQPENPDSPRENSGEKCNSNTDDLKASKQQKGQQDSPSNKSQKFNSNEVSPTKSKNKRRHDSRRRNASQRKQPTSTEDDLLKADGCRDESKSPTASPSPSPRPSPQKSTQETDESSHKQDVTQSKPDDAGKHSSGSHQTNSWRRRQAEKDKSREYRELKEQLKAQNSQIHGLIDQVKQQINKTRELESALLRTTKTCNQFEQLLQQELASRNKLETEIDSLNQTISRLKSQLSAHEKNKVQNDELIRVLNATLMERETEVSILKLKLTRLQTNPSSNIALNSTTSINSMRQDPCHVFATTGRSNSEFNRNSYIRSSMVAEAASARSSTTHLKIDRDASIWATVPEELTPSKRPLLLERNLQPIYNEPTYCQYDFIRSQESEQSTPLTRDRRYRTLPRSMKSPTKETEATEDATQVDKSDLAMSHGNQSQCQVTNLDDSNSTSQSSGNKTTSSQNETKQQSPIDGPLTSKHTEVSNPTSNPPESITDVVGAEKSRLGSLNEIDSSSHLITMNKTAINSRGNLSQKSDITKSQVTSNPPDRAPTTPIKLSSGLKKIFEKFKRSGSSQSKTDLTNIVATPTKSPFKRGGTRSTLVGAPSDIRAQMSPMRQAMNFQTDKPFAEWDTDMLVDWFTMIGLSMYAEQCRRWVRCGAHIMNATPAEVDKGLGITNHLHRKKLRLAISELNGDCDKITKASAKLDYLWVARWLDDIGLPQYKEAFINARIDGRVLNYLTVDDLISLGVKSVLHHASIKYGIRVLRSIEFDLQLLKRRASAEEIEQMNATRQRLNQAADGLNNASLRPMDDAHHANQMNVPLWTCHRVMEWLRMIDFAEFAPNLRGSGVHGGLIVFEDGFNIDTMCALLSIPIGRTLLRRHLSTFFKELIGQDLSQKKRQYQDCPDKSQLNPTAEIKTARKAQWLTKFRGSKVAQDCMDDYLCPMYPVDSQMIKSSAPRKSLSKNNPTQLAKISESVNV